jgi:hypothetical protein
MVISLSSALMMSVAMSVTIVTLVLFERCVGDASSDVQGGCKLSGCNGVYIQNWFMLSNY